jgi:hypothetical protein
VTVQNRAHVYMNFFDHKDLENHPLQLCPKVVKHPVYLKEQKTTKNIIWIHIGIKTQFNYLKLLFIMRLMTTQNRGRNI